MVVEGGSWCGGISCFPLFDRRFEGGTFIVVVAVVVVEAGPAGVESGFVFEFTFSIEFDLRVGLDLFRLEGAHMDSAMIDRGRTGGERGRCRGEREREGRGKLGVTRSI